MELQNSHVLKSQSVKFFDGLKSGFCGLESKSDSSSVGLKSENESNKFFQQRVGVLQKTQVRVLFASPSPDSTHH